MSKRTSTQPTLYVGLEVHKNSFVVAYCADNATWLNVIPGFVSTVTP